MKFTPSEREFIRIHSADDAHRLLLSAASYPGIDMPKVVDQIVARRQVRDKLPQWYANEDIIYPSKVSTEQASSELTGLYKQRLVKRGEHICDLTGGLGIDTYFFSLKTGRVTYIERYKTYAEAAQHNFSLLGLGDHIRVIEGDATEVIHDLSDIDIFYIDPARRGEGNKRVFALSDCEPDLPNLLPMLLTKAPKVIAKLSPMADIRQTLSLLPGTSEIHILSVKNECKELLFVIEPNSHADNPLIRCVNFRTDGKEDSFDFTLDDESQIAITHATEIKHYLYEPNSSILKAGAFKSVAHQFGLQKLAVSSHLYTSDEWKGDFPGRRFKVVDVIPYHGKTIKTLAGQIPQANITVRNFPLSVDELRKKTKIKEGGDIYLFATTLSQGEKVIIECRASVQ